MKDSTISSVVLKSVIMYGYDETLVIIAVDDIREVISGLAVSHCYESMTIVIYEYYRIIDTSFDVVRYGIKAVLF